MPYHVGAKGSNGCSGYPVVSDKGHVAGCHGTESEATAQLGALYANVSDATKAERAIESSGNLENPSESVNPKAGMKKPEVMPKGKKKRYRATKAIDATTMLKDMVAEGDFVIVSCEDETHIGIVQYVMTEGMLGIATSDYVIEASMDNPAILVRTLELEEDEGIWEESEYLVGAEAKMVTKIEPLALEVEVVSNGYKDCGCPTCETLNVNCENCPVCSPMPATDSEVEMAMYDAQVGKAEKPNYQNIISERSGKPSDGKLYARIIQAAKDKFDVYPSAVANAWVVAEYKRRGGTYKGEKMNTEKRDPSMKERERMAAAGTAMPDGSFPIANGTDLRNAIQSVGRAKDYNAAKEHIIRRARALGMTNALPEDWKNKVKKTDWGGSVFDLNPFVK